MQTALMFLFVVATIFSAVNLSADDRRSEWTVVLIGGLDSDPTPRQIDETAPRAEGNSGLYQLRGDLVQDGFATEYFNWNGTRAGKMRTMPAPGSQEIVDAIRQQREKSPEKRWAIVGNSWGGHTAWEVCDRLAKSEPAIPIELAVFLDASSAGRSNTLRPTALPENVRSAAHFFTRNLLGWRDWTGEPRLKSIDLGDPAHGFLKPAGPKYDSLFDVHAHIAAEWDEAIHKAIRQELETVAKPKLP